MTPHAASILPYQGTATLVYVVSRHTPPPAGSWARSVWDAAAKGFDQLFARRRREVQQRMWADMYRQHQAEARVRRIVEQQQAARLKAERDDAYRAWLNEQQAYADLPLIAAIRATYKRRPARRAARDSLARIMVQRAVEWADYRTPLIA